MWNRILTYLFIHKIITTVFAQESQITVYTERNLKGIATVLNLTGCLTHVQYGRFSSVNVSNACAIFYDDWQCFTHEFAIIPPNDPVVFDINTRLSFRFYGVSSVSSCNYCPPKILTLVQAYSFFVAEHEVVSGHYWLFNSAELPLNQTNICGNILDEFPIPFVSVLTGCVQFYSSNDCTTTEPEISKFQSIHGVQEWDTFRPVKSFSHCFLHCVPEVERSYVGVRGRYIEEEKPAFNGIRITFSSGLRENVYANNLNDGCHEAPGINVSNVTRIVAKDICLVLYANLYCNANRVVYKPTVLEAKGERIVAISIPDLYRKLPRVKSYMLCKTLARFEDYNLVLAGTNFFNDYATTNTIRILNVPRIGNSRILNISECSVLPHRLTMDSSIDSHGKCVLLFVDTHCKERNEKLQPGSPVSWKVRLLHSLESYRSIQLCSSNNTQQMSEVELHYNFTLFQYPRFSSRVGRIGRVGYNWTFSSFANQSGVCWELPYYYRSSINYPEVVVNNGCLKLFVGLKCSPFSQHFTITSFTKAGNLVDWGLKIGGLESRRRFSDPVSFTSCADLRTHTRIQSAISRQRLNFPYNFPNGTFYAMRSGEASSTSLQFCNIIPRTYGSKTTQHLVDEIWFVYVNNDCIFVFDKENCTMSENTTMPIMLNATEGPLERNLTENPFWGKPFSFVSSIKCDNFKNEYNELKRIDTIEHGRRSVENSTDSSTKSSSTTESSTTSQTIYIILSATFGTLLAIVLGMLIYFKIKTSQKTKLNSVELDLFFNGSDEPATSNEDAIQNTVVNKTLEIPSTNFTLVKSGNGIPVALGSGCFGKVIRGILHTGFDELNNCPLTRNVAIKIPKIGITMEQIRSLLCEIKICAFVEKHKNIVEFVGFCIENIDLGKISIILELCENGSLLHYLRDNAKDFQCNCKTEDLEHTFTKFRDRCKENRDSNNETFDYARLLRWCEEIAEGMEFLSSKNVLHADLATRNCLLDSELQIKITDFGLSRKLYDYGIYVKKSKAKLPWPWMALESLKSFTFSVKTDVWSYGVCLWEIFSFGDTPYPTLTWDEDFIENLTAGLRLTKPKLCPEYCYQLMQKCWNEDPDDRNDFKELRKAISDFRRETFCNDFVEDDHSGLYAVLA